MNPISAHDSKRNNAVFVYLILVLALQLFLLVVALEAFQADEEALAWPAAGLSIGLFATALVLARLLHRDAGKNESIRSLGIASSLEQVSNDTQRTPWTARVGSDQQGER